MENMAFMWWDGKIVEKLRDDRGIAEGGKWKYIIEGDYP